jgi:hypothetical protein
MTRFSPENFRPRSPRILAPEGQILLKLQKHC